MSVKKHSTNLVKKLLIFITGVAQEALRLRCVRSICRGVLHHAKKNKNKNKNKKTQYKSSIKKLIISLEIFCTIINHTHFITLPLQAPRLL
jgi:hypothetical protein